MKNNNILILLISTLGVGILCAIVASIAFTYYNGGFDKLTTNNSSATLEAINENQYQEATVEPETGAGSGQESNNAVDIDYIFLVNLSQKFQTCNTSLVVLQTTMATVQVDPSILEDEQQIANIQVFLDNAEINCAGLGDNDDMPDSLTSINKELSKAEKSIDEMVENYRDYFIYEKTRYLEKADTAFTEAMEYMQSSAEMLQQAMLGETP